jgi:hypothetical protein
MLNSLPVIFSGASFCRRTAWLFGGWAVLRLRQPNCQCATEGMAAKSVTGKIAGPAPGRQKAQREFGKRFRIYKYIKWAAKWLGFLPGRLREPKV